MVGTRSEQGERAVERLLTVVHTCQRQPLNALVYLSAGIAAHRRRQGAPYDTSRRAHALGVSIGTVKRRRARRERRALEYAARSAASKNRLRDPVSAAAL